MATYRPISNVADLLAAIADGYARVEGFEEIEGYPHLLDVAYSCVPFSGGARVVSLVRASGLQAHALSLASRD